ncbi:hypothetical protein DFY72_24130, partial [Escherichia coli]|nr:hypothetical protein [Escherichia coli]EGZ6851809.1 hypothetical protein [Escherichia coli]HAG8657438.1 hypothetical protein [Escherichia coli]
LLFLINLSEILTLSYDYLGLGSLVSAYSRQKLISPLMAQILQWIVKNELFLHYNLILTMICAG